MEKRLKVLISDDSDEFAKEYGQDFQKAGLEVEYAPKDGMRLLERIESVQPDLVLLDLFMPRLDGIGVIHAVQKRPGSRKPKFIVMSGYSSPTLEREVMMAGASYFVICPL